MTSRFETAARQLMLFHVVTGTETPSRRVASLDWRKVKVQSFSCLVTQNIGLQKYPKKGNNSVILKDKNSKNLHNLHMAITNVNP